MQHNELIKTFLSSLIAFESQHNFIIFLFLFTFIRKLVGTKNISLDVYTGTFGRLRLRDEANSQHEIYLYANATTRQIPAPMIYYKILANHTDNSGIVLIGNLILEIKLGQGVILFHSI